ncbi:uncharacterized protein LOC115984759 [Quercus lobata]|nr:uncharacterized protein LOC115984759 [Quercus lobata]
MLMNFLSVVGSMILIKKRRTAEVVTSSWRKLWEEWELRGLILASLTTQIILVFLGNRKRNDGGIWRKVTIWSAYLLADSIATMTAGILSNDIGELYAHSGVLDANSELKAFWAPLLLLHLGGTDAITAYSVEDNELWRRHLFGVITQAITTNYILFMAWTGSRLSLLFIVMFCVGIVKYLERVWVLYLASDNKFRDSIPDIPTNDSKIIEESRLKEFEGYHLKIHQELEVEVPDHLANTSSDHTDTNELRTAYSLFDMVKRLFADMILSVKDRDASTTIFLRENVTWEKGLRVIEIELGIMYDLMYTKAKIMYSVWGIARRIIGIFLTLMVFVVLLFDKTVTEKQQYSYIDFTITLVLLAVALLLELCSFVKLLLSDETAHWLIEHKHTSILRAINCAKKKHRWSNSIGQLNLLSIAVEEKPLPKYFHGFLKILRIDEMLEIHQYETHVPLIDDLKGYMFDLIKEVRLRAGTNCSDTDLKALFGRRGARTLKKFELDHDLDWCLKLDFDQSILIWHLATEICCNVDNQTWGTKKRCEYLSRYMLYLLVKHPYMLPIGMAHIKFQEIYTDVRRFIEEQRFKSIKIVDKFQASEMLIKVSTDVMLTARGNKSYFLIFHACKLASVLITYDVTTWHIIMDFWTEMLGYAASQCKGRHHVQQLRRGGELITHIWLLMAHLGLTDHFQIASSRATAEAFLS